MSHDPQSPTDAADFEYDDALCEDCGGYVGADDHHMVEAWEEYQALLCNDCFLERCEDIAS